MASTYMTAKTQRCSDCGDQVSRQESHLAEGRTVISSRNANKKVSADRFFCMDCHAAAEYKQHVYRLQLQAEAIAHLEEHMGREARDEFIAEMKPEHRRALELHGLI